MIPLLMTDVMSPTRRGRGIRDGALGSQVSVLSSSWGVPADRMVGFQSVMVRAGHVVTANFMNTCV